jgi:hypothetical protein
VRYCPKRKEEKKKEREGRKKLLIPRNIIEIFNFYVYLFLFTLVAPPVQVNRNGEMDSPYTHSFPLYNVSA